MEGGEGKKVTRLVLICWVPGGEGKHVKRLANLCYLQFFGVDEALSLDVATTDSFEKGDP